MRRLAFLILFVVSQARASDGFDTSRSDHRKHFAVAAGSTLVIDRLVRRAGIPPLASSLIAASFVLSAGYFKERTDPIYDRTDMEANAIGVGFGFTIGF